MKFGQPLEIQWLLSHVIRELLKIQERDNGEKWHRVLHHLISPTLKHSGAFKSC
jgi:hypothetical protein